MIELPVSSVCQCIVCVCVSVCVCPCVRVCVCVRVSFYRLRVKLFYHKFTEIILCVTFYTDHFLQLLHAPVELFQVNHFLKLKISTDWSCLRISTVRLWYFHCVSLAHHILVTQNIYTKEGIYLLYKDIMHACIQGIIHISKNVILHSNIINIELNMF